MVLSIILTSFICIFMIIKLAGKYILPDIIRPLVQTAIFVGAIFAYSPLLANVMMNKIVEKYALDISPELLTEEGTKPVSETMVVVIGVILLVSILLSIVFMVKSPIINDWMGDDTAELNMRARCGISHSLTAILASFINIVVAIVFFNIIKGKFELLLIQTESLKKFSEVTTIIMSKTADEDLKEAAKTLLLQSRSLIQSTITGFLEVTFLLVYTRIFTYSAGGCSLKKTRTGGGLLTPVTFIVHAFLIPIGALVFAFYYIVIFTSDILKEQDRDEDDGYEYIAEEELTTSVTL